MDWRKVSREHVGFLLFFDYSAQPRKKAKAMLSPFF
jgi:hypothetical protein